jgi:hypothetical protein
MLFRKHKIFSVKDRDAIELFCDNPIVLYEVFIHRQFNLYLVLYLIFSSLIFEDVILFFTPSPSLKLW